MIDEHVRDPWPERLKERLASLEQGDVVFGVPPIGYYARKSTAATQAAALYPGDADEVAFVEATPPPDAWIIVTQSCDICEEGDERKPLRPFIRLAPVYRIRLGEVSRHEIGIVGITYLTMLTNPEFVGQECWVADLRFLQDIDKGLMLETTNKKGFANADDVRSFAEQISYLAIRPAYDATIIKNVLEPLRKFFQKSEERRKAAREAPVREFRLKVSGPPWAVQLIVVLDAVHDKERIEDEIGQWFHATLKLCKRKGIDLLAPRFTSMQMLNAEDYANSDRLRFDWIVIRKPLPLAPAEPPAAGAPAEG